MAYTLRILRGAQKQLEELQEKDYRAVKAKIELLKDNPRPFGCEKLKNRMGYRIRQGNYRILYDIYDNILLIEIIRIGNRKDVYR
jgi:mRNA interferase RelE/StbE